MQQNYEKRKRINKLRTSLLMLMMVCFAGGATAQQNVYMHTGSRTLVGNETVKFYDSGGESSGPAYYWERWFSRGENYTFTFKPESGKKIQVTFKQFTAYTDNNETSQAHAFYDHPQWALRINNGTLSIHDGLSSSDPLITTYTGSVLNEFTVLASGESGALTFHFESGYREEGWYAEVKQVDAYSVQKPSISFEVCSDDVVLNANNNNATLYYTTDGNDPVVADPLTGAILYEGPFNVALNTTVKAIAVVDGTASDVASLVFTSVDETPIPGVATVTREGNTITMTPAPLVGDINETYQVWYKIGEDGALQQYIEPFEWSTPRTKFYVYTRAQTCSDKMSAAVTLDFDKVQVPDPTITFTVTDQNTGKGTVQINCPADYVLSYTDNGSNPVPNTAANTNSVTLNNVAPGTTIKAIAFKVTDGALDPDYQESDIVTLLCLPGGEGQSGAYGDIVILDDREDHSWSYFSDGDQPIHRLNPADVKITYTGYGNNTMTTTNTAATGLTNSDFNANVASNQVAVNHDAPENQFIYLKTLEAANADGSGNYPYTMIPNPFQVRPTYSSRGEGNGDIPRATNTLLNQNFDGSGFTIYDNTYNSGAWYTYNAGNGNNWELYQNSSYAHSGDYNMCYAYNSSNAANCYLVSEPFSVSASMTQLSVSMYERVMLSNYAETFEVFFVKASEVTTLAAVASATHYSAISSASYTNDSYAQVSGSIASSAVSALAGQSVRVVVHCTSAADQYRLYIDDITVTETTSGGGGGGSTIECNTETFSGVTATAYNSSTINLPTGWQSGRSNTNNAYAPRVCNYNNGNTIGNYDGNYLIMSARQGTSYYNWAIAPQYEDITSISFRFRFSSPNYGQLEVGYLVGTSLYTLQTISTSNTYSNGWNQYTLSSSDVATINNNDGQLVFMFSSTRNNNTWYHVAIDDVEICYTVPVSTYNVNIASGITGGTVTASPTTAAEGATVTLTATPSGSNELSSISATGNTSGNIISVNGSGSTYTFTMPAEDVTVNATFVAPQTQSNYRGFYAWRVKSLSSGLTIQRANGTSVGVGGYIDAEEEIKFVTDNEEGNEVEFEALWAQAWVTTSTSTAGLNPNVSYERNFMVLSGNPGSTSSTTQWPTSTSTTYTDGENLPIYQYSSSYPYSLTQQIYTPAQIGSAGTINQLAFNVRTTQNSNRTLLIYLSAKPSDYNTIPQTTNSNNQTVYRTIPIDVSSDLVYSGTVNFNTTGWKTITLDTPFEYDGTSNLVVTVMDNTNSARSMVFYTYSSGGTRAAYFSDNSAVDLGQYYYYVDGTSTYNNQIRFEKAISNLAGINVPLTITTYNPDGTGGSTSVTLSDAINCGADLKIENIKMNSISILSANGQNLSIGRGVTPSTSGGLCASYVKGLNTNATSPNYKIRLESGVFDIVSMIDGYTGNESSLTISGTPKVSLVLGNDYDRASEKYTNGSMTISEKLDVKTAVSVGRSVTIGSASMISEETFKIWVKSGKIGSDHDMNGFNANFTETLYMSSHGLATNAGYRKLFIEGGEISGVAGGMDACYSSTTTHGTNKSVTIRMTNGHVRSAIYGGAAQVPAGGDKEIIVTGGIVTGWIGAGCNGTADYDGQTYGEGFIYFGGDAISGGSGSSNTTNGVRGGVIFGAGAGRATSTTTGEMTFGTNVVIADECNVEHNVYGGGNYGYAVGQSNVYILGGTVQGDVFGGANQKQGPIVNVTMKNGMVGGNIYGGSNALGTISGLATINVSGGTVTNVFGGGYGEDTDMAAGTKINISGGTFVKNLVAGSSTEYENGNVYGGGEEGTVSAGNTEVNISGGTINNVYGAGKGDADHDARITGQTIINTSGGTIENVYGGGEAGDVLNGTSLASKVTIQGGTINGDVFGGGKMGTTAGNTMVNVSGGNIRGSVFGGAYGSPDKVYVAGQHSVNIMGGRVFSNVYGGSRNADDALAFTGYSTTEAKTSSVVNISAGQIDQQVYAAGYYGKTFGSVYVFVGTEAILKAPHKNPSFGDDNETKYKAGNLRIVDNIWAGGDWGTFSGGSFGEATVSGYSNIYVNGEGYNTETSSENAPTYMNIGGSILGSGTSCDAGKQGRTIMVSNYGAVLGSGSKNDNFPEPYTEATRTLYSIQRADTLILDNAHINFTGLAKVNSIDATEKYAIYSFDKTVRIVGGSSLFMNSVTSQIIDFWSASCDDIYAANATYTPVACNAVAQTPNKIRVNGGNYIEIYHNKMPMTVNGSTVYQAGYGMLNGFAYMMVSENTSENTCAYARPKWCQDTPIETDLNNATDGGWVSYDSEKNTYDIDGYSHTEGNHTLGAKVQMPYENHKNSSKNGELYFRIWRAGGKYSEREAVINILADGSNTFGVAAVSVKLPAWKTSRSYYVFESTSVDGTNYNTTVNYGADLKTYNSAMTDTIPANMNSSWIHYENDAMASDSLHSALDELRGKPNVNYGLVTAAGTAMSGNPLIVCGESDEFLAKRVNGSIVNRFTCGDFEKNPEVTFLLTYSNLISTNMSWDPMYVALVQLDENGNEIDVVKITIIVNTATTIDREFTTQVYAVMNGTGSPHDEYVAKVSLPTFELFDPTAEHASLFNVTNVTFAPVASDASQASWVNKGTSFGEEVVNQFAMEIGGATNEDNSDGWNGSSTGMMDSKTSTGELLGEASGRTPFAIDFRMTYNGRATYTGTEPLLGTLTFKIEYDNVKVAGLTTAQTKELIIHVQVYRRGTGNAFYLDGQNGNNGNDGLHPDQAVRSLSTILNRLGFLAGDIVYVVNTVDVASDLDWIGTRYDHVTIYRYPGHHQLATTEGIIDNVQNKAFVGPLINVKQKGDMRLRDIVLDGHNEEHRCPNPITSKEGPVKDAAVTAESPLAVIADGGTLILTSGAQLQHNTSTNNGGAVVVNDGGTLMMNEDATIRYNAILGEDNNGGGVYMDGTIIASDDIKIDTNYKATAYNNLYLTTADKVLTIGTSNSTDDFDGLTEDAHIGVTKTASDADGWYRVVNVESNSDVEWLAVPYGVRPNDIVYHDGEKFQLEKHTSPLYLYWVGTWVTMQDWNPKYESKDDPNYKPNDMDVTNITSREQLAWLISMVNGSNGATANDFEGKTININLDLNMEEYIWVPIGNTSTPFKGTFEGNGHVISGIRTPLVNNDAGLMGYTEDATVQDVIVNVNFTGNSINQGAIIGAMNGGTLCNAEAAGSMNGSENTVNMGGLVGLVSAGTVHSSFAVNTMTATEATTVMGGLVGTNSGNLYNSYANTTMTGVEGTPIGGLVGVNNTGRTVENCYVILGSQTFPAFAGKNNGTINYCYAAKDITNLAGAADAGITPTLAGYGNYDVVKDRKAIGYMYDDNLVILPDGVTNAYASHEEHEYLDDNHTVVWNGLLSVLNQWVKAKNAGYTTWNRATSPDINGDLPILAFPKDNCLGTTNGKFLAYSAYDPEDLDNHNGLDHLLGETYNGQSANIYLYNNASNVASGTGNNKLFIHEDAALVQASGSTENIKATVGVTFDNSSKSVKSTYSEQVMDYDWHFLSSALKDAPINAEYNNAPGGYLGPANITSIDANSYFPNGLIGQSNVKWDFYCYQEKDYHWINLKRSDHYYQHNAQELSYSNDRQFFPGKGYMMAISQDSYMSSTGTLNKGGETIRVTTQEPLDTIYNKGWNLVGNPYQAYLNLGAITSDASYYIFDADQKVYAPVTTDQSVNPRIPSLFIHPHQAFFMHTNEDKDFEFKYEWATATPEEGSYYRGRGNHVNYPLVNLIVENECGNRDLAIIELHRPELGGATKVNGLRNANFQLAASLGGQRYSLLFTPEGTAKVPVQFTTEVDGTYTLTWDTHNGKFTSLLLVDNMTGIVTDMLHSDHYTFDATTEDYASRFYLTYKCTGVDENNKGDDSFAFFDGSQWIVDGQGDLAVVDMLGRTVYTERLVNEHNRVNLNGVAMGVYLMRLSDGKNTMVQKIVVR